MKLKLILSGLITLIALLLVGCGNNNGNTAMDVSVRGFQGIVEEHLAGILNAERAIAASVEAQSGDWDTVKPILEQFADDLSTDAAVWYVFSDGHYYTVEKDLVDASLSDRDYFSSLMSGEDIVGDLVISKSTGNRSIIVATQVDGNTSVAIGVSVDAELLSQLVTERLQLPENMYFFALDQEFQTPIHSNIERIFAYPAEFDESVEGVFESIQGNDQGVITYTLNGDQITATYHASEILGWQFFIAEK